MYDAYVMAALLGGVKILVIFFPVFLAWNLFINFLTRWTSEPPPETE